MRTLHQPKPKRSKQITDHLLTTKAVIVQKHLGIKIEKDAASIANIKLDTSHGHDKVLLRIWYLSIDPYIRNRLTPGRTKYISSIPIGCSLISMGIAEVMQTDGNTFKKGELMIGMLPWQTFAFIPASNCRKLCPDDKIPITYHLGLLGYPGLTAYECWWLDVRSGNIQLKSARKNNFLWCYFSIQ